MEVVDERRPGGRADSIQGAEGTPDATGTLPALQSLSALNPQQRAAVDHPADGGALVVVAGAGSGKTATLAARAARLIAAGIAPTRLLLLTFSRRAAAEMQRRVGIALAEALGLGRGMQGAEVPRLPWCGTFHSVAARLVREAAPEIGLATGFTVLDRGDAEDLMGLARERAGLAARERRFPLPATCVAIHSRMLNTGRALADVLARDFPWCEPERAGLEQLFAAFAAAKHAQHAFDYDDLLLAWWHLMQEPAWAARIRGRFDAVLVDEAQDINHLQADIVQALRPGGAGLTLVGDDAQAIYGFRGADVAHFLDFPERLRAAPAAVLPSGSSPPSTHSAHSAPSTPPPLSPASPPPRILPLERNYRSTAPILAASNAVIALAERRFAKTLWTERAAHDHRKPALFTVADEAAQAEGVARAVLAACERGLALKGQAVLFRTAHHSMALELELARRHIPFVKYGGLRFAESAHVKDVLAVLRWADNPAGALAAWRVARLVPGFGPASARRVVEALAAQSGLEKGREAQDGSDALDRFKPPPAAAAAWAELRSLLAHLRSEAARWPDDLHRALAWYRPQLERLHADAPLRWADLQQLAALASGHASRTAFVTELALDPPAASSDEARDPSLDEDYLILSTIHSAKGQEWNAVHVLNVVDGCMPADVAVGSRAELEEERRLLYVAMTRARDELTLWVPQRFYVTQQRAYGDRHVYALRSRFIPDELLPLFEPASTRVEHAEHAEHEEHAEVPAPASTEAPRIDLLQRLFAPRSP